MILLKLEEFIFDFQIQQVKNSLHYRTWFDLILIKLFKLKCWRRLPNHNQDQSNNL